MDQLRRDVSEVILIESQNAQRIDKLHDSMNALNDTIHNSISKFATGVATQAQALVGFRELHAKEIAFIHKALSEVNASLNELKAAMYSDKDKINAVEKDIAAARGSLKAVAISWSGFVALIAFIIDKAIEILGKK